MGEPDGIGPSPSSGPYITPPALLFLRSTGESSGVGMSLLGEPFDGCAASESPESSSFPGLNCVLVLGFQQMIADWTWIGLDHFCNVKGFVSSPRVPTFEIFA